MDPGPRFEAHIQTSHPFVCPHCDLRYVDEDKLKKHERSHHKGKVKRDEIQTDEGVKGRSLVDGGKMDESLLKKKDVNKTKGPRKAALAFTLQSRGEVRRKSVEAVTDYWKCNHCEEPFPSEPEMRSHQDKAHVQSCTDCSMKFIHAVDFKRHQVERHNAISKGITKCLLCGEAIENKSLASHKKAKHVIKCGLCSLEFVQKNKLWRHMIEEHKQGTWVNRPVAEVPSKKTGSSYDRKSHEHPLPITKLGEGRREVVAVKKKEEKSVSRKISKLKEEKWETVKDKKERADDRREQQEDGVSGGKTSTSGEKVSNKGAKATNTLAKVTNTGVKATNTMAKATNMVTKATTTVAKATNTMPKTNSAARATNSDWEGKGGEKKHPKEEGDEESEKLEECRLCKEVCFQLLISLIWIVFAFPGSIRFS